jgi:hypothetical protein
LRDERPHLAAAEGGAAAVTGQRVDHHGDGPPDKTTRRVSSTSSGKTGSSSMDLAFTRLLPGAGQTVTVNYRSTENSCESVYVVFPDESALGALNTSGS